MSQTPLTPEQATAALLALHTHGSIAAAAKALNIPRGTFDYRVTRARAMVSHGVIPAPDLPDKPVAIRVQPATYVDGSDTIPAPRCYESAWQEWMAFIGQAESRYTGPERRQTPRRRKIVIASDFHIPFHHKPYVAELFAREADADLLIINGDLQDFYSISRFIKYEHVPIDRELAEVTLFLEQASQTWPHVLIVGGNHDHARFEKQLRDRLDPEMVKVVEFLSGGSLSPIAAIAKKFGNIEIATTKAGHHNLPWIAQVGDLIVTHAEKFSVTPGAALRKIEEWLADQAHVLNLAPWKVLVQAHTHQLGIIPWHADRLLVEGGCLASTMGYQLQARIGGRPQRRGYVTLEQVNGVTDINSVKVRWLDMEPDL